MINKEDPVPTNTIRIINENNKKQFVPPNMCVSFSSLNNLTIKGKNVTVFKKESKENKKKEIVKIIKKREEINKNKSKREELYKSDKIIRATAPLNLVISFVLSTLIFIYMKGENE